MKAYRRLTMDAREASRRGFPAPRPGLAVQDTRGRVWVVTDDAGEGLADLGFAWTAFIPLATSVVGGLFGSHAASKEADAMKAAAQAQIEIERLRAQTAQANQIPWNLVIIAGAAVLGLMALRS